MPRLTLLAPSLIALVASPITGLDAADERPSPIAAEALSITPPAASGGRGLVIDRSADGLFYVEAQVNGTPVHFVVDSGSSVVVLNAVDAARAAVGATEDVDVETAGGAASMRRAQIKRVVLAGRTLSNIDAAIVDRNLKVSLLGQSALSQLASVSFRGDRLAVE